MDLPPVEIELQGGGGESQRDLEREHRCEGGVTRMNESLC